MSREAWSCFSEAPPRGKAKQPPSLPRPASSPAGVGCLRGGCSQRHPTPAGGGRGEHLAAAQEKGHTHTRRTPTCCPKAAAPHVGFVLFFLPPTPPPRWNFFPGLFESQQRRWLRGGFHLLRVGRGDVERLNYEGCDTESTGKCLPTF